MLCTIHHLNKTPRFNRKRSFCIFDNIENDTFRILHEYLSNSPSLRFSKLDYAVQAWMSVLSCPSFSLSSLSLLSLMTSAHNSHCFSTPKEQKQETSFALTKLPDYVSHLSHNAVFWTVSHNSDASLPSFILQES